MEKLHNIIIVLALLVLLFPSYGSCGVDDWSSQAVWFKWTNPPIGAERFQTTFFLKDLKTGEEFLTGGETSMIYSGGNGYTYVGYPFMNSDYQIRSLTCIAVFDDLSKIDFVSYSIWRLLWTRIPIIRNG